jgi:hypothetical protein
MHKGVKMRVRGVFEEDYAEISSWFTCRGWPVPPAWEHLPRGDRALCVDDENGKLLCCAFIYLTETPLTILEWTATNPAEKSLKIRYKSLKMLLEAAKAITKKYRHDGVLIQFLVSNGLKKFYEKNGFQVGDTKLTSMVAKV